MLKRRTICMILAFVLALTGSIIFNTDYTYAATGTKDSLIAHAKSHLGDKYNTFDDRSAFSTDWCAQFIEHCSAKAGLNAKIPTSGCSTPNDMAYNIVDEKKGKITFVNKTFYNNKKGNFTASSRVSYNANYKPRKGDLIIFSSDADYWWTHIGIVTADSSYPRKNVSTIEGNTGNDSFTKSIVAAKNRTSTSGFYIVAYVTPNYEETYYLKYSDGLSSTTNDSSVIPTSKMACGAATATTTKKFQRAGYKYDSWYIFKYADGKANYWCRDKATGKIGKWIAYDKIPATYYKVKFPHGGKLFFSVPSGTYLYLTPVWEKN